MKHSLQMSETLRLGIILALSGGFMDAYSYLERGNVFANAQTGNLLLFGVNLAEGNYFAMLSLTDKAWRRGIVRTDPFGEYSLLPCSAISSLFSRLLSASYLPILCAASTYDSTGVSFPFCWKLLF